MTRTRAEYAAVVAIALAVVAIATYPGGTSLDHTTRGYAVAQNFLSDLGMTVAYDGRPNVLGATCFVLAIAVLVFGLGGALIAFVRTYAVTRASRRYAWLAALAGALAALAFAGVAATPENRAMTMHVWFTRTAFWLLPFAALFLTLATRASGVAARNVVATWTAFTVVLLVYATLPQWGPSFDTYAGLTTHVIAQKIVVIMIVLTVPRQAARTESVALRA